MDTQSGKSLHPLLWAAGFAIIVFCGLGVAAMMGWIGGSVGKPADTGVTSRQDKARAAAKLCLECGVIQSVHEVDTKGTGSGAGAVGGAVVGGVLGHQVGEGDNRKVGAVVGAVAGGLLGNEIEKQVKTTKNYEVTVRFDDGAIRVINEANVPSWRVGDKVKVIAGVIHTNT
jgi:outer membrane lipoprotein SlyB